MKKILAALLVMTLFQGIYAFAQDDDWIRKHGHGKDNGGVNNPNPFGSEKGGNLGSSGDQGWKEEKKQSNGGGEGKQSQEFKQNRKQNNTHLQRQTPNKPNQSLGGNPSWQGNTQGNNSNSNRNFNSQNQFFNRQQNQGFSGNQRESGGNNVGINRSFNNQEGNKGFHNGWNNNKTQGNFSNRTQTASIPPKLQKMGIKSVPAPIRDHSHVLVTDRKHSVIALPKSGPSGTSIAAKRFSANAMSGRTVQNHMTTITSSTFTSQINVYNTTENRTNNYYWHTYNGFNYCHYYDPWGYNWYGWYIGPTCFWTRWYWGNWWWYDDSYDRWCYWHDGGWWWQDPYHVNVVYVYNNGNYTSVDSNPSYDYNSGGQTVYQSNDGSRRVKVMGDGRDAFLYDTSNNPSFEPLYLASGVKDVKFSDTSNGGPLQIMLTLGNGAFEMFDAYGNRYHGGDND